MSQIRMDACPNCGTSINGTLIEPRTESDVRFCQSCQHPLLLVAGKYLLEGQIAEGGFGTIYKARHVRLQMDASRVIKFIRQEIFQRASVAERFAREVQITSSLSQRNEHIVRIFDDFGEVPKIGHYYVMEHLVGATLAERIETQGALPIRDALWVFRQLCAALIAAHQAQVVHRDLKPENIFLIPRDGTDLFVKVIDFGIAKPVEGDGQNLTRGAIGTPEYMPPEQCVTADIDHRADIYAMAVIFYEMIAGHTPFRLPHEKGPRSALQILAIKLSGEPYSLVQHRPDLGLSEAFNAFLLKAMAKSPHARFQSVQEMLQILQELEQRNAFLASGAPLSQGSMPSLHAQHAQSPPISIGYPSAASSPAPYLPTGELSSGTGNFPVTSASSPAQQNAPSSSPAQQNAPSSSPAQQNTQASSPAQQNAQHSAAAAAFPAQAPHTLANQAAYASAASSPSQITPSRSAVSSVAVVPPHTPPATTTQPSLQEDLFLPAASSSSPSLRPVDTLEIRSRTSENGGDAQATGPSRLVMGIVSVCVVLLGIFGGKMLFGPPASTKPSDGADASALPTQRLVLPMTPRPESAPREAVLPDDPPTVRQVEPSVPRSVDPPVVRVAVRRRVRPQRRPSARRIVQKRTTPSIPVVREVWSRCPVDGNTWMQIDVSGGSFRLNRDYDFITKSSRYLCVKSPQGLNKTFILQPNDDSEIQTCAITLRSFRKRWFARLIKTEGADERPPDYCLK